MAIPTASNFPDAFDDNENLFLVHDALRLRLAEDYAVSDSTIQAEGDAVIAAMIPATGIITLTEQCSDLDKRAISFHYGSFNSTTYIFSDLDVLEEFTDVPKAKRITNITVNVMAKHHNHIKNALVNIQEFCGIEGTVDTEPFGDTLEGRINFLRNIVLIPQAWFSSDIRTGNVPLEIEFKDMSFRLGTDGNAGDVTLTWDFGDQTTSMVSTISATDVVSGGPNVLVRDEDGGTITKTYYQPGIYDVKLTVENDFGSESCIFPDFINARAKAPNEAVIRYVANTPTQKATPGVPPDGPFDSPPTLRSPINTLVEMNVPSGENPSQPGYSYGGEILDEADQPIDPIIHYTWSIGDDLIHPNSRETKGSWSVGGIYDMKLRVDTEYNAYRITTYEDSIDIIENQNLWLWTFQSTTQVRGYEYGLISETFKTNAAPTYTPSRNTDFLNGEPSAGQAQQRREFIRNTGFAPRGTTGSGQGGTVMLYWASGRNESDPATSETINRVEYNGFTGTYTVPSTPAIYRQWNWANFNSNIGSYFAFGRTSVTLPNTSPTNPSKQTLELETLTSASEDLVADNYLNGANELTENPAIYEDDGTPTNGHFSVYRTTWKDSNGYMTRNDAIGTFFRIKSFYRTEGVISNPFINIRKMQDIQGPTKLEGELVAMSTGVFFLNNSGSVSKFDTESSVWETGGPGVNSLLYRSLQDTSVSGFDSQENTMLASSDGDKRAYLSFDYSSSAFLKFNEIDLTFSSLGSRPDGDQWMMGVY